MPDTRKPNLSEAELRIVKTLLDSKAVQFDKIGEVLAKVGPSAVFDIPGEEIFCGTMRRFIRTFHLNQGLEELENLANLKNIGKQING
jgi:hypothetical protein